MVLLYHTKDDSSEKPNKTLFTAGWLSLQPAVFFAF